MGIHQNYISAFIRSLDDCIVAFCNLIRAYVCFMFKFRGVSDHFCFLSVLIDLCRKAHMARQFIRSGNFRDFNLHFFWGLILYVYCRGKDGNV